MEPIAEVIGIDHVYLTVKAIARSEPFYDLVLRDVLGFRKTTFTLGDDPHVNYYNRLFGIVLRPARVAEVAYDPYAPGLHHLCLRVADEGDLERVARALSERGIEITPPRLYPAYAPDYHALFLEDPDGLRLEITNFRDERRRRMVDWESEG